MGEECTDVHEIRGKQLNDRVRRSARLNMRLTPQELDAIRDAARLQGTDVTTFVLGAALDQARAAVGRTEAHAGSST